MQALFIGSLVFVTLVLSIYYTNVRRTRAVVYQILVFFLWVVQSLALEFYSRRVDWVDGVLFVVLLTYGYELWRKSSGGVIK